MVQNKILSPKYNMAWGMTPGILSMLLCSFIPHQTAIYWGVSVGIISCLYFYGKRKKVLSPYLLYTTTGILTALAAIHLIQPCTSPSSLYILTIEIAILLPVVSILLLRNWLRKNIIKKHSHIQKQSIEATLVSCRIILILGIAHLAITLLAWSIQHPMNHVMQFILLTIIPSLLFITAILINQQCIGYFNRLMKKVFFLPIITPQGDVIGKCLPADSKKEYLHPVIRIAVSVHGLLLLRPKGGEHQAEKGKNDILIEDFLHFGETLEEGAWRMIKKTLHKVPKKALRFHLVHPFSNEHGQRLVYLFSLCLADEKSIPGKQLIGGKLWTFKQIEHELGKHFFSECFEHEYDQLKSIISIREKYREK